MFSHKNPGCLRPTPITISTNNVFIIWKMWHPIGQYKTFLYESLSMSLIGRFNKQYMFAAPTALMPKRKRKGNVSWYIWKIDLLLFIIFFPYLVFIFTIKIMKYLTKISNQNEKGEHTLKKVTPVANPLVKKYSLF